MTVRVVAADNGQPVPEARIRLSGVPDVELYDGPNRVYVNRDATTDVSGRFVFTQLPSGAYRIIVDSANRFVRPRTLTTARLDEPGAGSVTVRLVRAGVIEGRIRNVHGIAMPRTNVQALRAGGYGTLRGAWAASASTTTDARGAFRLSNLAPGEYFVIATQAPDQDYGGVAPDLGFANTYYPGSVTLSTARAVTVRAGRDSKHIDFQLIPSRLAEVSIEPVDSAGTPFGPQGFVSLTRQDDLYLRSSFRETGRRENGRFVFAGVPPGNYVVVASTPNHGETAYARLRIDDADVVHQVQTNRGARISGRVLVDGRSARADGVPRVNIGVSAFQPPATYGATYSVPAVHTLGDSDRFELTGLRGPVVLEASIVGGALLSIQREGKDLGPSVELVGTEILAGVLVNLTTKVAELAVTLSGNASEAQPALVVVFPEERERWPYHAQALRGDAPSQPDEIRFRQLPEGRYLIAAVPDPDVEFPTTPAMLEQLRPLATPLTLTAGVITRLPLTLRTVSKK
jgi:hypothetical protein